MTRTAETMALVLDAVAVTLSDAVRERVGGLGDDPLVLVEVQSATETKVAIGERAKLVPALVADGLLDQTGRHFVSRAAPRGYVWIVIDWTDEVSTILHPLPAPKRDRRAS